MNNDILNKKNIAWFLLKLLGYSLFLIFLTFIINRVIKTNDLFELEIRKIKVSAQDDNFSWEPAKEFKIDFRGVEIEFDKTCHSAYIETGLSGRNSYFFIFYNNGYKISEKVISPDFTRGKVVYTVFVPEKAIKQGYDELRIYPLRGDGNYSISYIKSNKGFENSIFPESYKKNEAHNDNNYSFDTISINIDEKDFDKIKLKRDIALYGLAEEGLNSGFLVRSDDDYVPAQIEYNGTKYDASIRLKGDQTDHLTNPLKWSLRVKLKGNNTIFGLKRFSIQHPCTRTYLNEWLFHKILADKDLISLRYDFIRVFFNGRDLGIFALEEHFDKRLLEHNSVREAPVIKFNEDIQWDTGWKLFLEDIPSENFPAELITDTVTAIDVFRINRTLNDPALFNQFITGRNLLESFRKGELKAEEVFDLDKMATFYALVDLTGSHHAIAWHNQRFYYNPITSLLEPVGFDALEFCTTLDCIAPKYYYSHFNSVLFKDNNFFRQYIQKFESYSDQTVLDNILSKLDDELREKSKLLKVEYSDYDFFQEYKPYLYEKQKIMAEALNPDGALKVYFKDFSNGILSIKVANTMCFPVELKSLTYGNTEIWSTDGLILSPKERNKHLIFKDLTINMSPDFIWTDELLENLELTFSIIGSKKMGTTKILFKNDLPSFFYNSKPVNSNLNSEKFKFLIINDYEKKITIRSGKWTIDKKIIIPEGFKLICSEGCELDLIDSAAIVSYSPVEFCGSFDYPISISSSDATGGGLVVSGAKEKSILKNVIFSNLQIPAGEKLSRKGAVTFCSSPVDITFCQFYGNKSKSALHIIDSECLIEGCKFKSNSKDSFLGDFIKGTVIDTVFSDSGRNSIDMWESILSLNNIRLFNTVDTGIKIRDNSNLSGSNIYIVQAKTGILCINTSTFTANNINMKKIETGLYAHQGDEGFSSSHIIVNNLYIEESPQSSPYLIEESSTITVDGKLINE